MTCPALGAIGEDHPLLGARERYEEASGRLGPILQETATPSVVVKTDGVMLKRYSYGSS